MADQQPVTELIARANSGDQEALDTLARYFLEYITKECLWAVTDCGVKQSRPSDLAVSVFRFVTTKFKQGGFACVADRKAFRTILQDIIHYKAVDLRRKENAARRSRKRTVDDPAALEEAIGREVVPYIAAATQDFLDRLRKQLEPREWAIVELILDGWRWGDIPEQLLPKYGKITRYMIDRTREKIKRLLTVELSTLQ